MSARTAAWFAWAVCALTLGVTVLSFLLIALSASMNTPAYFFWLDLTVIAVGYSVIGAIIASRLPDHPIGWICCAIGLIAAVEQHRPRYRSPSRSPPRRLHPWRPPASRLPKKPRASRGHGPPIAASSSV